MCRFSNHDICKNYIDMFLECQPFLKPLWRNLTSRTKEHFDKSVCSKNDNEQFPLKIDLPQYFLPDLLKSTLNFNY